MTSAFKPFAFPTALPSWYAGHMARAMRVMEAKLPETHLFVEVRDARLPLTSINPALQRFGRKEQGLSRLIVYCRRDLGDVRFERMLQFAFQKQGDRVIFANSQSGADARAVLREILRERLEDIDAPRLKQTGLAKENRAKLSDSPEEDLRILIGGMPNVGKSSLLNALRRVGMHRGKASFTGADPGVTRKVTGVVRLWDKPPLFVYDTPGVMVKYLGKGDAASEKALKIALSGGIRDHLFSLETLGEYLLWRLNHRFFHPAAPTPTDQLPPGIQKLMPPLPMTEFREFTEALARRLGMIQAGGVPDLPRAIRWFIEAFRSGKLGGWALDDLTFTGPYYARFPDGQPIPDSIAPPPSASDPVEEMALVPAVPQEMILANPSMHMHDLVVPKHMPVAQRVNLAVAAYTAIEEQRFLYPHPVNMSRHALRKAEKVAQAQARSARFQRMGITSRPKHLNPRLQIKKQLTWKFAKKRRSRRSHHQGNGRRDSAGKSRRPSYLGALRRSTPRGSTSTREGRRQ